MQEAVKIIFLRYSIWIKPSRLILLFITNSFKPKLSSDNQESDNQEYFLIDVPFRMHKSKNEIRMKMGEEVTAYMAYIVLDDLFLLAASQYILTSQCTWLMLLQCYVSFQLKSQKSNHSRALSCNWWIVYLLMHILWPYFDSKDPFLLEMLPFIFILFLLWVMLIANMINGNSLVTDENSFQRPLLWYTVHPGIDLKEALLWESMVIINFIVDICPKKRYISGNSDLVYFGWMTWPWHSRWHIGSIQYGTYSRGWKSWEYEFWQSIS